MRRYSENQAQPRTEFILVRRHGFLSSEAQTVATYYDKIFGLVLYNSKLQVLAREQ